MQQKRPIKLKGKHQRRRYICNAHDTKDPAVQRQSKPAGKNHRASNIWDFPPKDPGKHSESHGSSYSSFLRLNAVSHLHHKEGGLGTGCISALGPRTGLLEKDTNKNPQTSKSPVSKSQNKCRGPRARRHSTSLGSGQGKLSLFSYQIVKDYLEEDGDGS